MESHKQAADQTNMRSDNFRYGARKGYRWSIITARSNCLLQLQLIFRAYFSYFVLPIYCSTHASREVKNRSAMAAGTE